MPETRMPIGNLQALFKQMQKVREDQGRVSTSNAKVELLVVELTKKVDYLNSQLEEFRAALTEHG